MKQYLLSIYQPDGETPPPEVLETVMRDVNALIDETKEAGVWVFNGGLYPPARRRSCGSHDGDVLMTDGPYAEGKEHIGGFLDRQGAGSRRGARVGAQDRAGDPVARRSKSGRSRDDRGRLIAA